VGTVMIEKALEINQFMFGHDAGKETVRVSFELPLPSLSQQEEAGLPMFVREMVTESFQPIVDALVHYLAGLQFSGELGPIVGIPVLQRHLAQASEEMITALRVAKQAEDNPPPFHSDN